MSERQAEPKITKEQVDALAEAWASMDGKLDLYIKDRDTPGGTYDGDVPLGYFDGYQVEAREILVRLFKRGFALTSNVEGR